MVHGRPAPSLPLFGTQGKVCLRWCVYVSNTEWWKDAAGWSTGCVFLTLLSRIRNLGAEVNMIEDLMDPNVQHGELGLMFTTLKVRFHTLYTFTHDK